MRPHAAGPKKFRSHEAGSVGVLFGLMLFGILTAVAITIDMSRWWNVKAAAQSAADTAALAGARELSLPGVTEARLASVARRYVEASLGDGARDATIETTLTAPDSLRVSISLRSPARFVTLIGVADAGVAVSATARSATRQNICLLVLDQSQNNALEASKQARITATECSVFVNSRDSKGLSVKDSARLRAQRICTSGGYEGGPSNFQPAPRTDCPPMPDPLAKRAPPTVGGCDHQSRTIESGTVFLRPGVYCGGLKITNNAIAKLDPGTYVIKDGKLIVDSRATLEGVDVGFYLLGNSAQFEFDKETTISIAAPASGPMSGLLFYEDRATSPGSKHMILSNNAHTLLGTIYLPRGILFIDAERPISNRAAYTILIANRIQMISGPELVLNARYEASSVPVPSGVGGVSGAPTLVR
jgi:hypothetical protein